MRRQFFTQVAHRAGAPVRDLLPELADLASQGVDLLLLAKDDLVQLIQQVFAEAGLDLQLGQALFGSCGCSMPLLVINSGRRPC